MRISLVVVATLATWGCVSSVWAGERVRNGSFEELSEQGRTAHWGVGNHYRISDRVGMNGTRGMAYVNESDKNYYEPIGQTLKLEPGTRWRVSMMARTEDLSCLSGICVEWYAADGKWISGTYKDGPSGTTPWTRVEAVTPPIPSDAVKCRVAVYVRKGGIGKAWFDDISVVPFERKAFGALRSSAYRNVAAKGRVTFVADINIKGRLPGAKAVFKIKEADSAVRSVPAEVLTEDRAALTIDVERLALCKQNVICEVKAADGTVMGSGTLSFTRVRDLPAHRVWIDGRRRTIVGGKPFFPLGIYLNSIDGKGDGLCNFLTGPFNCAMPYKEPDRAQLDLCRGKGIEVIYPINTVWPWSKHRPAGVITAADAETYVEKKVAELKDHPALLAWYVNDEIPVERIPDLVARQKLLERLDPEHPTWTVLYQFSQVRDYYDSFDVIGTDPYPVPQASIGNVADWTRVTRDEVMGLKPLWQVPQAFDWGDYGRKDCRFPTREELVNMTWQCVANGANGLIYFAYRHLYRKEGFRVDRWADICAAAASVKSYVPVILSDEDEPVVSGATEELSVRAWKYQGNIYLAVVNNTRKTVTGKLKTAVDSGAVLHRLFGSDGCTLTKEGEIEVELPGLGVEFVRLGSAWR